MKMLKVLRVDEYKHVTSPIQDYFYGCLKDVIGKKMVCTNFCYDDRLDCAKGFYAVKADRLIYCLNAHKDNRVFEVEMGGEDVDCNIFKHRYSEQTIVRMLPKNEVRKLIKEQANMHFDYYHACYPINPLKLNKSFNKEKALILLRKWSECWSYVHERVYDVVLLHFNLYGVLTIDSVDGAVHSDIYNATINSIGRNSSYTLGYSIRECIIAYTASLFPSLTFGFESDAYDSGRKNLGECIKAGAELWKMGLVTTHVDNTWRLHKGKNAEVVLEISEEALEAVNV